MVIVRAVQTGDLDELWELIRRATYGLTTLQISRDQLSERVELSAFALQRKAEKPTGEPYVLVMQDSASGALVGVSCIFSKTGGYEPFYTYRRVVQSHHCELLGITRSVETLQLQKIHDGPTEIGSLYLAPEFRGQGRGRLLSLSRFALMAAYPKRFAEQVIAEMRGVMSEQGVCPFWEAIGRHFFIIDFPQADSLSTLSKRFIEELMPQYPIYIDLLPSEARAAMGEVHRQTRPALAMLQAEGFRKQDLIDIFDGGPVVQCQRDQIDAVRRTRRMKVGKIVPQIDGPLQILASLAGGFRAITEAVQLDRTGQPHVTLSQLAASTLQLGVGDDCLVTAPYPPDSKESAY